MALSAQLLLDLKDAMVPSMMALPTALRFGHDESLRCMTSLTSAFDYFTNVSSMTTGVSALMLCGVFATI